MTIEMTPLPRGRHRLSREEVAASQRMRLMRAMAEVMAEKGYARTSVADVLGRARVSRETFYELFASKEDCFMSAFEDAYRHIGEAVASAAAGDGGVDRGQGHRGAGEGSQGNGAEIGVGDRGADWFAAVLENYLAALAADPIAARVFLIEVYAAGPAVVERRMALQRQLVAALAALIGATDEEDRFVVEALLAAVVQMVTARLAVGDIEGLRGLRGPILALVGRLGLVPRPAD